MWLAPCLTMAPAVACYAAGAHPQGTCVAAQSTAGSVDGRTHRRGKQKQAQNHSPCPVPSWHQGPPLLQSSPASARWSPAAQPGAAQTPLPETSGCGSPSWKMGPAARGRLWGQWDACVAGAAHTWHASHGLAGRKSMCGDSEHTSLQVVDRSMSWQLPTVAIAAARASQALAASVCSQAA